MILPEFCTLWDEFCFVLCTTKFQVFSLKSVVTSYHNSKRKNKMLWICAIFKWWTV